MSPFLRVLTLRVVTAASLLALQTACPSSTTNNDGNDGTPLVTNTPPTFTAEGTTTLTTAEDTTVQVRASVSDADGNTVTVVKSATPLHGSVDVSRVANTFTIKYTPASNYNGPDTFALQAEDGQGGSSPAITFAVTVTPVPDAPQGFPDTVSANEDDAELIFGALLSNDFDVDGGTLSIVAATNSSLGATVTVESPTSVKYVPGTLFVGMSAGQTVTDAFTYTASNGTVSSSSVTVLVTIQGANDPLVLNAPTGSVHCRPASDISGAPAVGSDADTNDTLTYSISNNTCSDSILIGVTGALAGECPAVGADCTFRIDVSDGTDTLSQTVTLGANTIFVEALGVGPGNAWGVSGATGDLQAAVTLALATGKDVWVKAQTLTASSGLSGPTGAYLTIDGAGSGPSGTTGGDISIVGGFAGTERLHSERPQFGFTTLDGDVTDDGADGTDAEHLIRVVNTENLTLEGLLLKRGYADDSQRGGGLSVENVSTLTVRDCAIVENFARGNGDAFGGGAAIDHSQAVTFLSTIIAENRVSSSGNAVGGGVYAHESGVTFTRSVFVANRADGQAAVSVADTAGTDGSTAMGGGAAIDGSVLSRFDGCAFVFNTVVGGKGADGGAASANGRSGGAGGSAVAGAIGFSGATGEIVSTSFEGNQALGGNGGVASSSVGVSAQGANGGAGGAAEGAAIWSSGDLSIASSSFQQNSCAGGWGGAASRGNDGPMGVSGDGGAGGDGGSGGRAVGAAVVHVGIAEVAVSNSVFTRNEARPGSGVNGAVGGGADPIGGNGGAGGSGGDAGANGGALFADTLSVSHCSFAANRALVAVAGSGGAAGVGGTPGASGSGGSVPSAGSAGIESVNLAIVSSAFFDNLSEGSPSDAVASGTLTGGHNCSQTLSSLGAVLTATPFESVTASGELFLKTTDTTCTDAGLVDPLFPLDMLTNRTDLSLETGAPDASAYYAPRTIRSLSIGAGTFDYVVGGEGPCTVHQGVPFAVYGVTGTTASTGSFMPVGSPSWVLLDCGGVFAAIAE
jgi:VCBS repeat-containing protein